MSESPWYQDGLRFQCQRTGNCCRTHGEYAFVYLAENDVEAIAAHLGKTEEQFLEESCAEDNGYTILRIDEPSCPFLQTDNSCGIYPVRPKQCATWPFWEQNMESKERWEGPVKSCCPGIGQGPVHSAETMERIARETEDWYEEE